MLGSASVTLHFFEIVEKNAKMPQRDIPSNLDEAPSDEGVASKEVINDNNQWHHLDSSVTAAVQEPSCYSHQ